MCGACGERGDTDWARALCAGLSARLAVAAALTRLAAWPGLKVVACPGGWLVSRPTGASTVCVGLTALVAAVRSAAGPGVPDIRAGHASGPVPVPVPDGRRGMRLRVAADTPAVSAGPAEWWTVPTEDEALALLASLARPPWSLRRYLAELSGVAAPWGLPAEYQSGFDTPERASDLIVWAEWARQAGSFAQTPFAARCPLDGATCLDVEIRAGHVVRAVCIDV
jgi:hypothetical protein